MILFPLASLLIYSQEFENQIEEIFENTSGNTFSGNPFSENEIEYIEYRRTNKLNLIYANRNDLMQFPTFDLLTVNNLIDYIKNNPNTNIAKLSKDLDLTTGQEIILDNCAIISKDYSQKFFFNSRTRNNIQFDKVYGFENQKFLGDKLEYTQKITSKINHFETGFVIDKDAGEMNFIDFYSGYIKYENLHTKIIVGDYFVELGLGNILSREFPTRKGSDIISPVLDFGGGIHPSRSTLDYSFFRGSGIEQSFNLFDRLLNIELCLAGSKTAKSGNIDTTLNVISSIYQSGLYRTQTEISKKEMIEEKSLFSSAELEFSHFLFGIGTLYLDYNYPIQSSSSSAFNGKSGLLTSIWGRYMNDNFAIGGETSFDAQNNFGIKIGSIIDFDNIKLAFHFRSFAENYRSPYGSIFGEFSNPANEIGLYTGIIYKLMQEWRLSGFFDIYKSYGPTYYVPEQVRGFNIFVESNYKLSKEITLLSRIVYENKTDNIKQNNIDNIFQKQKFSLRNDLSYNYSKNLYTRFRVETVLLDYAKLKSSELGFVGFVEFNYFPFNNLRLFTRISYFSTDSYDSAIWEYEYFIYGVMNTFAAYLDGSRYLFGMKYDLFDLIRINILYSNTSKNNIKELSSGNDRILSNSSNNLIFQLEIEY